jgi:hypothetical protein
MDFASLCPSRRSTRSQSPSATAASARQHCCRRLHASPLPLLPLCEPSATPPSRCHNAIAGSRRQATAPRRCAPQTPNGRSYAQAISYKDNGTTLLGGPADSWNSTSLQIFDHRILNVHWPDAEYLHRALR